MAAIDASPPLRAALFARCRRIAELARGAAGAKEHDLVLTVVVEVDEVSPPADRRRGGALLAFAADKPRRHNAIIASGCSRR
jgi:hypothetical protein